jgi:hypothetical protein
MRAVEEPTGRECGDLPMPARPVKLLAQVAGGIEEAVRGRRRSGWLCSAS